MHEWSAASNCAALQPCAAAAHRALQSAAVRCVPKLFLPPSAALGSPMHRSPSLAAASAPTEPHAYLVVAKHTQCFAADGNEGSGSPPKAPSLQVMLASTPLMLLQMPLDLDPYRAKPAQVHVEPSAAHCCHLQKCGGNVEVPPTAAHQASMSL